LILFFLPNLQGGGAERVLTNVLLELHKSHPEQNYTLLLERKEGEFLIDVPESIPVYSLNTSRALTSVWPFIKFCRKHRPEMVIATLGASLATSLAKPFLPKQIVVINRIGNTIGAEKNLYTNSLKRYLFIQANKTINKLSDHIIFQCQYMGKDYINETGIQPKKYDIIYNPVDVEGIQKKAEATIDRVYDFIAVGRLMAQKDYLTMIRGFAELIKTQPKMQLGILGKGSLKEDLLKEINDLGAKKNISLLGYVANPYPYIKQARFLVSSSLYEGFSNVIIEALCLGTPVVATNCPGGNQETIEIYKNGLLFKVGDPLSLANALQTCLENESEYNTLGIAKDAIQKYNKKRIVEQYNQLIIHYSH
jgi:glycosyltransferase involved in cell wall biosynthesis